MPNPRDLPQKHWDLGQQIPNPRDPEESPPWQKTRGRGLDFVVLISGGEKSRQKSILVCWKREVSSWTSRILILVMLPIIVRHLLFKLSWRMSLRDLMWSLAYHVPSNDCAHISLFRNESTGLRDERECFSWWLRCCVGTAAPVAMYQALYHVRLLVDWLSLMKTADAKIWRTRSAFHLFQQLDKISNKKAIQESRSNPTPDTWIWFPPFRHSLVGYWPSLALVKSSSAFVKREVARLLQFHSHEISYSRPTAKNWPIYCHMLPKNCATTLLDTRSPLPKYLADLKLLNSQLQKNTSSNQIQVRNLQIWSNHVAFPY